MFGVATSDDYRPVAWIGRYPVRVTSIICGLFVLGMLVTAICRTAEWDYTVLAFQPYQFLHGRLWQPLTAPLIQQPDFFFLFNVLFFYWSGNQVEQYLGVRRYLILIALLVFVPPLLLIPWGQVALVTPWYGSRELSIGMFIAFAALYPNMEVFGWVTLKWLAFAGLLIASMEALARHYWPPLFVLWGMSLISFGFIRQIQGRIPTTNLPTINLFRRKPKLHIVQRSTGTSHSADDSDVYASVDPILDKIAKSGMGSLTENERRQLERARNRLLKKSG